MLTPVPFAPLVALVAPVTVTVFVGLLIVSTVSYVPAVGWVVPCVPLLSAYAIV